VPCAAAPGVTSHKQSRYASERDTPRVQQARALYQQQITALDLRRLMFVDASGVHRAMTRLYGRAPTRERVLGHVPQNYGQHVTRLGALGVQGLHAVMAVEGATDTEVFRTYVKQVLGPTLTPGDIVVRDHLRAYKAGGVQQAIARRGARLRYVSPYSPDPSPIESCWSQVKIALRKAKARTCGALATAMTGALVTVTSSDAQRWFRPCGYVLR
jgi:transposase